jgi:hypothetical protein
MGVMPETHVVAAWALLATAIIGLGLVIIGAYHFLSGSLWRIQTERSSSDTSHLKKLRSIAKWAKVCAAIALVLGLILRYYR